MTRKSTKGTSLNEEQDFVMLIISLPSSSVSRTTSGNMSSNKNGEEQENKFHQYIERSKMLEQRQKKLKKTPMTPKKELTY